MLGQDSDIQKKNAPSTKNSDTELNKTKYVLLKGPKPLQKLKFYLDIKNQTITSKLEGKIKDLGGVVEFFLDRGVTHVISDRTECTENSLESVNSPTTPRLRSIESQYATDSPLQSCESPAPGRLRQKTRADAMLEKVRPNPATKVRDPLQNAKLWGIPIWTVNKVFLWLERVTAALKISTSKSKKVKIINISSPFIKFEPITRTARPVYKSIKTWPTIDLESNVGKSAFCIKSQGSQNLTQNKIHLRKTYKSQKVNKNTENQQGDQPEITNDSSMTRKQRARLSIREGNEQDEKHNLVGGYCEICHCEYREIGEHVRSEQHLNFVKNDANFLELDSLISAGANVEAFLRLNGNSGKEPLLGRRSLRNLNGKSSPEKCNGVLDPGYSPPLTRNRMPRTRSSNRSHRTPPPTHHLRSRGYVWSSPKEEKPEDTTSKRTYPKTKRISADERLVADNKTYYKVEVMTTKLRSSGLGSREVESIRPTQISIPEESESLVVKFKRVRRSELSVLNDEAENFMFPRKDDPSCSEEDTDDGPETTQSSERTHPSSDIRSSESEKQSCEDSNESEITRRKRKRVESSSNADTIETMSVDNFVNEIGLRRKTRKLYTEIDDQFDESSRDDSLLGQEAETNKRKHVGEPPIADTQSAPCVVTSTPTVKIETCSKNNGDCTPVKEESEILAEIQAEEMRKELDRKDLKFSFELLPVSEPWYTTFRRQDQGEEYYTCVSDPADYCTRFLLPYQLPYLLPLDPKVCIDEYLKKRAIFINPTLDDASVASVNEDSNSLGTISLVSNSVDSSVASSSELQKLDVVKRRRKRKSKFLKVNSVNPRKSPRQHASTLAILSSLIHQRKKREKKSLGESDTSRASLATVPEESFLNVTKISEEELKIQEQNAIELERVCEEILTAPLDDLSEPELLESLDGIEIKHHPDAIELLQNFNKGEVPLKGYRRKMLPPLGNSLRTIPIRRKRKKNRTGWPKKKKLFVKRSEQKPENRNGSLPELEDYRLTEVSGELEMCELEAEVPSVAEKRTNGSVHNLKENSFSEVQVRDVNKNRDSIENNTIQGVSKCTELVNNSEIISVDSELSAVGTQTSISDVLVENMNNNSFNDSKIKEECTTDSSCELNNGGVVEESIVDCKKRQRNSSSDCSTIEEVVPSKNSRVSVNVTLDKWENAEKVLTAKVQDNEAGKSKQFQPFVKVQKIENNSGALQNVNRRLRSSTSPERKLTVKRARLVPPSSPRSPRKLRTPRGKWYRER